MNQILIILTLIWGISILTGCDIDRKEGSANEKSNNPIDTFTFIAKPDKILEKSQYAYIYIISDTTAKAYARLAPNPNNEYVNNIYRNYISHIKTEFKQDLVVNNIKKFPRKWNTVNVFKGKYYVYSPSDWIVNTGYYVSDSIIYITKSDPDDLFFILEYKPLSKNLNQFHIINYSGEHKHIQIELLNPEYGIYVWTFINQQKEIESRHLMQDSRFITKLPMIVCDCGKNKCFAEFKFDKPDFDKLTLYYQKMRRQQQIR